ncbi:MAG: helix-turn-helix transcriptional regulator [Candidatus Bathyarchaeia archaeon]|jgi:DNA-binding PadR family transcriptional regulator
MQPTRSEIAGNLQAKIMMILRDEQLCGVDLMKRLRIRSPGTIYPVLDVLRKKGLIDFKVETAGTVRKKAYFLTNTGRKEIREHLTRSARFCCDTPTYITKIVEKARGLVEIKRHQRILCTLDYEEIRRFLKGADVTFSSDLKGPENSYDTALSFLGVGIIIGKENADITDYVKRLYKSLKRGGSLLAVEIEKTDNLFSQILFEDVFGLKEPPGLQTEELKSILEKNGFATTKVTSKNGLLYALAQKPYMFQIRSRTSASKSCI